MTPIYIGVALFVLFLACGRFYEKPQRQRVVPQLDGTYTLILRTGGKIPGFRSRTAALNYAEEMSNA